MEQASESRVMLTGYMDVPSERLNAVKDALIEHINLTRAEKGCILFEVREHDAHPGRFLGSVDVHLSHNTVLANEMNAVKLVSVLQ